MAEINAIREARLDADAHGEKKIVLRREKSRFKLKKVQLHCYKILQIARECTSCALTVKKLSLLQIWGERGLGVVVTVVCITASPPPPPVPVSVSHPPAHSARQRRRKSGRVGHIPVTQPYHTTHPPPHHYIQRINLIVSDALLHGSFLSIATTKNCFTHSRQK